MELYNIIVKTNFLTKAIFPVKKGKSIKNIDFIDNSFE